MLELIFQGFLEWVYSLIVEIWEFIADGLLDIMGLDFAYLQTHVPIIGQMEQIILAAGWALLLGNLVFQALKSMAAGLGFEGEDPKLLFSRTFVFAFLLMASPQICRIGLDLTSNVMDLLKVPDATDVGLVEEGIFGSLTAAWLMAMICSVIVMFKVLKLVIEIAERYVILAMLTICAPLAFAMGGSKTTASIFSGWCRMFGSMCLLMVTNLVCCKMLFSVVSTVPSGLDVLPWMVLIFAIVKVAHKSDAIITRIGLNPAITGGPGRTLPGMLAYTVIRTAAGHVVKGVGGGKTAGASASGARPGGGGASGFRFGSRFSAGGGGRFGGARGGGRSGGQTSGSGSQSGGRPGGSFEGGGHGGAGDSPQGFGGTRGGGRYSSSQHDNAQQSGTRQENSSHTSAQQNNSSHSTTNTSRGGGRPQQSRRSSVPPGGQRPRSYVPPSGAAAQGQGGASAPNGTRPAGTSPASTPRGGVRYGPAGNPPKQPNAGQPGPAGTAGGSSSTRSTHSATQTTGGSTVNNTNRTSTQTTVTAGGGRPDSPTAKAPSGSPRTPRPSGPTVPKSGGKQGDTRSTRRGDSGAAPVTPGPSQPGGAGKPPRSTQRPDGSPTRSGRNTSPTAFTPPAGRTSTGPVPQEQASRSVHVGKNGTPPNPARQEPRKPVTSAAPPGKGGAPTVHPGGAGTAPTAKQAAGQPRTAQTRATRAKPAHRSPPRPRGGNGHG